MTLVGGFGLGVLAFFVSLSGQGQMTYLHPLHDGLLAALGGGTLAETIIEMHWMVASFWLCVLCLIIHVVVSLLTPEELTREQAELVWANPLDACAVPAGQGQATTSS